MTKDFSLPEGCHTVILGMGDLNGIMRGKRIPASHWDHVCKSGNALSIALMASEIIAARRGRTGLTHNAPWIVAFGFGLLHGFGFAGALAEIGLPQAEVPVALLFFNIGVELGQLVFVAAVLALRWLLTQLLPQTAARQHQAAMIAAYAIGIPATYWFVERTFAILV